MTGRLESGGAALLVIFAGTLLSASSAKQQVVVGPNEIAAAMTNAGAPVVPDQIELLSSVPAAKENPKLKLVSVSPVNGDLVMARLRCESTRVCLPFYVLVHWRQDGAPSDVAALWRKGVLPGPHPLRKEEILVRRGKNATMIFEGKNIRMTLPVLCLQSGGKGQQIRVMSKDPKRIYVARVSGEGTVRAGGGD